MTPLPRNLTPIVRDIPGAEGPVVDRAGRLFMVCPNRGQILQVSDDAEGDGRADGAAVGAAVGAVREHANTGGTPAGLAVDRQNHLWVADMKRGVLRVAPDGQVSAVVTVFQAQPMRGCNDLAFDPSGHLWMTAPAGSKADNPVGEVYCRHADGSVRRVDQGLAFPNGIAVSATGRLLVVAETYTRKLWAYDITAPGQVANKRLLATMPGEHPTGADGMDFDAEGHLLATNWGGESIDTFDANGNLLERFALPFRPSNLHFAGPDLKTLYITEHTHKGLWRAHWPVAGQRDWGLGQREDG